MDFFNRQDRIKRQSRLFFTAFFPALALAVIAIYFAITFSIMSSAGAAFFLLVAHDVDPLSFGFFTPQVVYSDLFGLFGDLEVELPIFLPASLYGDPPRILSAWSFFRVSRWVVLIILVAALGKCRAIRRGGGTYIAKKLGGVRLEEPRTAAEKKLINIVEEMSLASGLPMPAIYILPRENTINAVTAGLSRNDAVIAVTQGALNQLTRDELQGVIAHEFAHILNEDCVLNMIMAGWLYGLLFFTAAGKSICSAASELIINSDLGLAARWNIVIIILLMPIGALLRAAGSLGHLTASVIEAAFSRSREHLADAFAMQFTRNPKGLAGALKKIGGTPGRTNMRSGQALMLKSFFIASPNPRRNGGLLSSHPTLKSRILALDPQWDKKFIPIVPGRSQPDDEWDFPAGTENLSNSSGTAPHPSATWLTAALAALTAEAQAADGPSEAFSKLAGYGLRKAAEFQASLPYKLQWMLKTPGGVEALVYALFLDARPEVRGRQMELINQTAGRAAMISAEEIHPLLTGNMRLPLLELANPALRNFSETSRRRMGETVEALAAADGRVDIFEIAAMIILKKSLLPLALFRKTKSADTEDFRRDAVIILTSLAHLGTPNQAEAEAAFQAALTHCPDPAGPPRLAAWDAVSSRALMEALERLGRAPLKNRVELLRAAVACAIHDGTIITREYHLLAALAAALDLPLPWPSIMAGNL